jgi:hypothetical protein
MTSLTTVMLPLLLASCSFTFARALKEPPPTVQVRNGTYQGVYNPNYDVDYFLGMPFAQAPTGSLRLARPVSLNTSFSGVGDASQYGPGCIGFSVSKLPVVVFRYELKLTS